jgi:hypothetical protein
VRPPEDRREPRHPGRRLSGQGRRLGSCSNRQWQIESALPASAGHPSSRGLGSVALSSREGRHRLTAFGHRVLCPRPANRRRFVERSMDSHAESLATAAPDSCTTSAQAAQTPQAGLEARRHGCEFACARSRRCRAERIGGMPHDLANPRQDRHNPDLVDSPPCCLTDCRHHRHCGHGCSPRPSNRQCILEHTDE